MSDLNSTRWPWIRRAGYSRHPNNAPPNHSSAIPLSPDDETAPEDLDTAHVSAEANLQQLDSTQSGCIRKFPHRHDGHVIRPRRLMLFVERFFPPYFRIIYRHSDRQDIAPSFEGLIAQLALDRELGISAEDIELCSRMEGKEKFKPGNCPAQFESSGMCVEMPRFTPMPTASPTTMKFLTGFPRRGRYVFVDPERLSPIGLSVLTWILAPTKELPLLLNFMSKITFRNSFVEALTSTNHTGETEENAKMIVLMRSWLRVFDKRNSFIHEHGEVGHWAAYVGRFSNQAETKEEDRSERPYCAC